MISVKKLELFDSKGHNKTDMLQRIKRSSTLFSTK